MDALQAYYNNLFGIEVTTLGIITAGVLVFLQILHSSYSYKDMFLSLQRKSVRLYAMLSVSVVLLTGSASLFFATAQPFVPRCHHPHSFFRDIFTIDFTALISLFSFLEPIL